MGIKKGVGLNFAAYKTGIVKSSGLNFAADDNGGGGNVEFMTSIYSIGQAYIDTGIDNTTIFGLRVKGRMRVDNYSGYKQQIICGYIDYSSYTSQSDLSCYVYAIGSPAPEQYWKTSVTIKDNITSDNVQVAGSNGTITVFDFDLKLVSVDTTKTKKQFSYKIFTGERDNQSGTFFAYTDGVVALEVVELYDISGNMIAELKPAIVNGENGMYDTIGQQFYGNANSSGSLVCE